jgi:hypothetical protein
MQQLTWQPQPRSARLEILMSSVTAQPTAFATVLGLSASASLRALIFTSHDRPRASSSIRAQILPALTLALWRLVRSDRSRFNLADLGSFDLFKITKPTQLLGGLLMGVREFVGVTS